MFKLKKVTFSNLLSYGKNENVFEINDQFWSTIGIIGNNGHGKTAILDAICLGLYNKPYRLKVNKKEMINRENKKKLLIKVEVESKGDTYIIERGISPAVIRIEKNGIEEDLDAKSTDVQKYIETQIIGVNEKIFRLVFMIGLGNFNSFFKLGISDRRDIFEYIIGMNVLSVMFKKIKKFNTNTISSLDKLKYSLESNIKLKNVYEKKLEDVYKISKDQSYDDDIRDLIEEIEKDSKKLESIDIDKLYDEIESIEDKISILERKNIQDSNKLRDNKTILRQHSELVEFLNKNDSCPVCKQSIKKTFKKTKIKDTSLEMEKLTENNIKYYNLIDDYNDVISKHEEDLLNANKSMHKYDKLLDDKKRLSRQLSKLEEKQRIYLDNSDKIISDIRDDIIKVKSDNKKLISKGKSLDKKIRMNSLFIDTLNDNGVKKYIYNIVLKKVNRYINEYISEFNFNGKVEIKDDLSCRFYYKLKDDIKYHSFSNGERLIIDFSFIFGLLKFIEEFYGFTANFLFFDEILDTSLDRHNKIFLLENLKRIDKNIIIISHDHELSSLFDETYNIEKVDGFSTITKM